MNLFAKTRNVKMKLKYALLLSAISLTLTACGGSSNDSPKPPIVVADTTPDSFSFLEIENAPLNKWVESAPVTITGINTDTPISIENGEFSIDGGEFVKDAATITNNQTVKIRLKTPSDYLAMEAAKLSIGSEDAALNVTTKSHKLFFLGYEYKHGFEPRKYDGKSNTVALVADTNQQIDKKHYSSTEYTMFNYQGQTHLAYGDSIWHISPDNNLVTPVIPLTAEGFVESRKFKNEYLGLGDSLFYIDNNRLMLFNSDQNETTKLRHAYLEQFDLGSDIYKEYVTRFEEKTDNSILFTSYGDGIFNRPDVHYAYNEQGELLFEIDKIQRDKLVSFNGAFYFTVNNESGAAIFRLDPYSGEQVLVTAFPMAVISQLIVADNSLVLNLHGIENPQIVTMNKQQSFEVLYQASEAFYIVHSSNNQVILAPALASSSALVDLNLLTGEFSRLVSDAFPDTLSVSNIRKVQRLNNDLFVLFKPSSSNHSALYKVSLTSKVVNLVAENANDIVLFDNRLFYFDESDFYAPNTGGGYQSILSFSDSFQLQDYDVFNNELFLNVRDGANSNSALALYKYDVTTQNLVNISRNGLWGTGHVLNEHQYSLSSLESDELLTFKLGLNSLFFSGSKLAEDYAFTANNTWQAELKNYKNDEILDLYNHENSRFANAAVIGDNLYYTTVEKLSDEQLIHQLWRSDGTSAGTNKVTNFLLASSQDNDNETMIVTRYNEDAYQHGDIRTHFTKTHLFVFVNQIDNWNWTTQVWSISLATGSITKLEEQIDVDFNDARLVQVNANTDSSQIYYRYANGKLKLSNGTKEGTRERFENKISYYIRDVTEPAKLKNTIFENGTLTLVSKVEGGNTPLYIHRITDNSEEKFEIAPQCDVSYGVLVSEHDKIVLLCQDASDSLSLLSIDSQGESSFIDLNVKYTASLYDLNNSFQVKVLANKLYLKLSVSESLAGVAKTYHTLVSVDLATNQVQQLMNADKKDAFYILFIESDDKNALYLQSLRYNKRKSRYSYHEGTVWQIRDKDHQLNKLWQGEIVHRTVVSL